MTTTTKTPAQIRRALPRLATPRLPEQIASAPPPLAKIAKEYGDLYARATEAMTKVMALEARRPEAETSDSEALAAALRAAKPDPGPKAVEELEGEIESARREVTGLVDATHATWAEVKSAFIEHAPAWREQLQAGLAKHVATGTKGFDTAGSAVDDVAQDRALLGWISDATTAISDGPMRRGPIARRFPRAPHSNSTVTIGQVPYSVHDVVAALRAWLDGERRDPGRQPPGEHPGTGEDCTPHGVDASTRSPVRGAEAG
jgi:hypothetical protein